MNMSYYNSQRSKSSFVNKEEYDDLKSKGDALQSKLNFRLGYEKQFQENKLSELEQEMEALKYKNQIANKRNEDLLNSIQKDIYKCYRVSTVSSHSKSLLENEKKKI